MKYKRGFNSGIFLVLIIFIFMFFFYVSICRAETSQEVSSTKSNWKDYMYDQYDYETFKEYEPANMKIDYKNVDYELLSAAIFYAINNRVRNFKSYSGTPLTAFKYSYYLKCAAQRCIYDIFTYDLTISEEKHDEYMAQYGNVENYEGSYRVIDIPCDTYFESEYTSREYIDAGHTYNTLAKVIAAEIEEDYNITYVPAPYLGCWENFYYDIGYTGKVTPMFKCVFYFAELVRENP